MQEFLEKMKDKSLLIIASQPRSGSTLLQALLSNNNQVATVSEPWVLLPFLSYKNPKVSNGIYNSSWALTAINDFKNKIQDFDINLSDFLLSQYAKTIKRNEIYVLDKTPRYYEILTEIIEVFPNAKIIILKRNPLAVLSSILETWTLKDGAKLSAYSRDLLHAPRLLFNFEKTHKSNTNIKSIKYEDLIENPELTIKELYNWLQIPFETQMLEYSRNEKYKGNKGDPTGIKKHSNIERRDLNGWKRFYEDRVWKDFFYGYANFLGPKFLKDYGDYTDIPAKRTYNFSYYQSLNHDSKNSHKIGLKKYLLLYFYSKFFKSKVKLLN